jgi:hypothetical protein
MQRERSGIYVAKVSGNLRGRLGDASAKPAEKFFGLSLELVEIRTT